MVYFRDDAHMKIFVVPSWYPSNLNPPSGAFFATWAKMLAGNGHEVTVVANILHSLRKLGSYSYRMLRRQDPFDDQGLTVFRRERINRWPRMPERSFRSYQKNLIGLFHQAIKKVGHPDIVLAQSSLWAGAALAQELTQLHIPMLVAEHHKEFLIPDSFTPFQKGVIEQTYVYSEKIICNSSAVERAILFAFPAANRNITTIHNPVPIPNMPPGPSPASGETFRFIAVAVYRPEKRLDLLLDAFGALTRQHDNIRLTLVGDGVQRGALKKQIGHLGLGDLVDMTGFLPADGVMEQLALGHCLVMPSDVETFGLALVEAMSMGLPVIATKCGGPEDIVRPTVGALIPVNDREALTEAMHSMMSGYDRYDRAAIRAYAVDRFGPQRYVAAYGSLFRELASSP